MSLRQSLGRFGGVPLDLHPAWMRVHYGARCIGMDMIAHCTDPDERKLPVEADWMRSVYSILAIGGKDRRNAKAALQSLIEAGLLTLGDGWVRIELVPIVQSTCADSAPVVQSPCSEHAVTVQSTRAERVPENTQVPEIRPSVSLDRLDRLDKKDERERARADLVGFNWYVETLYLIPTSAPAPGSWREQYAFMGGKPDTERRAVASAIRADAWCSANKHLVSPEHVRKFWQKYLGGDAKPVLKPLVQTPREQLIAAREAAGAAQRELNRLDGLPWFDREEAWFAPARLKAHADLEMAQKALTDLTRDQRMRAVAS